jgi:hypothetical protein
MERPSGGKDDGCSLVAAVGLDETLGLSGHGNDYAQWLLLLRPIRHQRRGKDGSDRSIVHAFALARASETECLAILTTSPLPEKHRPVRPMEVLRHRCDARDPARWEENP